MLLFSFFDLQDELKIVFARLDCSDCLSFCRSKGVENVLGYRFEPAAGTVFDGEQLKSIYGQDITDYVNRHIGTDISLLGGMDENYGRVKTLDKLASAFNEASSDEQKKAIMKKTAKLRKRYRNTSKYYQIMKLVYP